MQHEFLCKNKEERRLWKERAIFLSPWTEIVSWSHKQEHLQDIIRLYFLGGEP